MIFKTSATYAIDFIAYPRGSVTLSLFPPPRLMWAGAFGSRIHALNYKFIDHFGVCVRTNEEENGER